MEKITLSEKDLAPLREIHSILSKGDALIVFLKVAEGLKSQTETHNDLGLTIKQYYTRLKSLVSLGLVQKINGVYTLTSLGEDVYQSQIVNLSGTLRDTRKHQMVDVLRKDSRFSEKDIRETVNKIG